MLYALLYMGKQVASTGNLGTDHVWKCSGGDLTTLLQDTLEDESVKSHHCREDSSELKQPAHLTDHVHAAFEQNSFGTIHKIRRCESYQPT